MKNLNLKNILFILSLLLTSCGDSIKEENEPKITSDTKAGEQTFEQEDFSFYGKTNLSKDMHINARTVSFKVGSEVKTNSFNLTIEAQNITFERDSKLIAYSIREYGACKSIGSDAGSIELEAGTVSGSPFIDLAGQNAGQIGIYSVKQAKTPLHPSHIKVGPTENPWFKDCSTYAERKVPKDVPRLLKSKPGGKAGKLYVSSDNHTSFTPTVSKRFSLGSYEALIEGITKGKTSWWQVIPRGRNGRPGEVCFLIDGEFLCKGGN